MINYTGNSLWGIKESGNDISSDIINIVTGARQFIVVGGYNFNFKNAAGAVFFTALKTKAAAGIPILMLMPPRLAGKYNPMPAVINNLAAHNIAVMLNKENHSKWIMSDCALYYGSSNFTPISWKKRIEVISIHHDLLTVPWKRKTVRDFYLFLHNEIKNINATAGQIKGYTSLVSTTVATWSKLKGMIKKFNPSVEKVRETLENLEEAEWLLSSVIEDWINYGKDRHFNLIYAMCFDIWLKATALADYAYGNIYNEVEQQQFLEDQAILDQYNKRHQQFIETVDDCISRLREQRARDSGKDGQDNKNQVLITAFGQAMENNLGRLLAEYDDPE